MMARLGGDEFAVILPVISGRTPSVELPKISSKRCAMRILTHRRPRRYRPASGSRSIPTMPPIARHCSATPIRLYIAQNRKAEEPIDFRGERWVPPCAIGAFSNMTCAMQSRAANCDSCISRKKISRARESSDSRRCYGGIMPNAVKFRRRCSFQSPKKVASFFQSANGCSGLRAKKPLNGGAI